MSRPWRSGWRFVLPAALLCALVIVPVGAPTAESDNPLGRDLSAILADPAFAGADVGLIVRRADSGEVLFDRRSRQRRQPASTGKLLTTTAALERLGPGHRFRTTVASTARRSGPVLSGDLYLRGGGDPTMLAADYQALAAEIADSGVRVVRGRLVADDSFFDDVRLGTGWAWDDEPYYYNAQTSALTIAPDTDYDAGSIVVRVTPGRRGAPAEVELEPANDYVEVVNSATTSAPGQPARIGVRRAHGDNIITVSGSIPEGGAPVRAYRAVWEPTGLAAAVFRDALARHGVRVLGETAGGVTPTGARVLAEHRSMAVGELLTPFLKLSNNMHAETLVKAMGKAESDRGTWPAGVEAVGSSLPSMGVDPNELFIVDGSGLSRMDQVAPAQLASLLLAAREEPWFDRFHAALPVAGVSDRMVGGTLRNRMRGTAAEGNVHAKTGSYTGVSALAGYVAAADGSELVFAMVSNQTLDNVRPLEDAVAVRLAQYEGANGSRKPAHIPAPRSAVEPAARHDLECSWLKAC
ncbi:D-alanyl-D-alanine carboxypeptidase/D-alanyl-D-alanine endopeptidase [Amycolatopsis cihanbeyliensis]|uniref:D-alanyl-D-alanine carboxypeptidase/D-alanyl-D-alanine-endopeptidase (Penicillin-binding protein 4) n=1 Tax=Amycolatopsis cihanbeyliensis TaxID=1128664 RepID=A0A542DDR8_AMYCI|nr:D-alanyl-D-alanine carboxypeptidase/D-alanyl-D-alanine-endopeptidase [Amycolatopsis cihanbeyliensis]TQJ01203.1 D-alanyl-D-alanine carboxypeptidase/D-alanyl-D-alanine-endopeptidase (penicillin-binding protein 4) [Amycolatopsis cihanbeyliensis]